MPRSDGTIMKLTGFHERSPFANTRLAQAMRCGLVIGAVVDAGPRHRRTQVG
jgi:hypothetical protein